MLKLPIFIEEHNDPHISRRLRDLSNKIRSRNRNHRSKSHHSYGFPHLRQPLFAVNQKTTQINTTIKINLKLETNPRDSGRHETDIPQGIDHRQAQDRPQGLRALQGIAHRSKIWIWVEGQGHRRGWKGQAWKERALEGDCRGGAGYRPTACWHPRRPCRRNGSPPLPSSRARKPEIVSYPSRRC